MTDDYPFDTAITTSEEFEAALGRLLGAATQNGIDPRGSWVYRDGDSGRDWEALIVELDRQGRSD